MPTLRVSAAGRPGVLGLFAGRGPAASGSSGIFEDLGGLDGPHVLADSIFAL